MQSAARKYDLSQYEYQYEDRSVQRPTLTVTERKEEKKGLSKYRVFFCGLLLTAIVSLVIYSNGVVVELGDQITMAANELQVLQEEQTRMQTSIDTTATTGMIEEYAQTRLGMGKAADYQITYVQSEMSDGVSLFSKNTTGGVLLSTYYRFLEYMKIG